MTPTQSPLPESHEELAAVAAAVDQPAQVRERALAELLPEIHRVAHLVGAGFRDGRLAEDLLEQGPSHVQSKLHSFTPGQPHSFAGWVRTVLYNLAVSIRRGYQRRRADLLHSTRTGQAYDERDPLATVSQSNSDSEVTSDQLAAAFTQMRAVLDRISWPAAPGVDTFAVWLFLLRQRIGARFAKALGGQYTEPGELASQIACWLPWHENERTRRFRATWPVLEDCWQAVGQLCDQRKLTAAEVASVLASLMEPGAISLQLWNKWTERARKHAREHLQPSEWETLFTRWILDR